MESSPYQTCAPNVATVPMLLPTVPNLCPAAKFAWTQWITAAGRATWARTLEPFASFLVNQPAPPLPKLPGTLVIPVSQPKENVLIVLIDWICASKGFKTEVPPEPAWVTTTSVPSGVKARWPAIPSTTNASPCIGILPRAERKGAPAGSTKPNVQLL